MLMAEETRMKLNEVLTHSFLLNMICDNLVYEIDYNVYPLTSELVHESFAHHWPAVADEWSNLAIQLNAKPVRSGIDYDRHDHNGDLAEIFKEMLLATEAYRRHVIELITVAELNDDVEVKIRGEELLAQMMPYRKQVDIWAQKAEQYRGNYKSFDARIRSFTTQIPVLPDTK